MFGKDVFDNPKPIKLLQKLIGFNLNEDELILDFFAGSSTTAHSVFLDNVSNDIKRRNFILVQLPEPISDKTEPSKNALSIGFKSLSKLSAERIRRAAAKIKEELLTTESTEKHGKGDPFNSSSVPSVPSVVKLPDLGFKVFKLDSTNIKPWEVDFNLNEQTLLDYVENIKPDRSEEDILYEILLKYGLELTLPISEQTIAGKKVFNIDMGELIVCLADAITLDVVEGIAKLKEELKPKNMRVVFKDSGFTDDVVKTNAVQILKQADILDVRSL